MSLLSVSKGIENICTVVDENSRRLNNSLWVQKFMLSSLGSLIIMVVPNTHSIDLYVGKMFYNFRLSPVLANYCVVDLGYYIGHKKENQGTPIWMRCIVSIMGMVFST